MIRGAVRTSIDLTIDGVVGNLLLLLMLIR
jgi:hypothetical protein